MQAYHNKPETKQFYVDRMKAHMAADELVRGVTWETNGHSRGCAVGCTLNKYDHSAYETELGMPEWLARLEDTLFENVSIEYSKTFPLRFLEAVPVGLPEIDFTKIKSRFLLILLNENIERVKTLNISEELRKQVIDAIGLSVNLHQVVVDTGIFDESAAWSAAWSAAGSAAWSAAWSAAGSAAGSAAESAAWSAESAARSAESAARSAESAAWSAESAARSAESAAWSAESAARSAAFERYADTLLNLLAGK